MGNVVVGISVPSLSQWAYFFNMDFGSGDVLRRFGMMREVVEDPQNFKIFDSVIVVVVIPVMDVESVGNGTVKMFPDKLVQTLGIFPFKIAAASVITDAKKFLNGI
jgi:hypothetical protein